MIVGFAGRKGSGNDMQDKQCGALFGRDPARPLDGGSGLWRQIGRDEDSLHGLFRSWIVRIIAARRGMEYQ